MISTNTPSEVERPQFDMLQKSADELCPADADMPVGQVARSISDAELELHIIDAGERMKDAMARWEISGCFNDLADGHRWLTVMEDAEKARRKGKSLEAEGGVA